MNSGLSYSQLLRRESLGQQRLTCPQPLLSVASSIDDIHLEDIEAHKKRMGRWRHDVAAVVASDLFWEVCAIAQRSHSPLQNHLHFTQKKHNSEVVQEVGIALPQLVCGKARNI